VDLAGTLKAVARSPLSPSPRRLIARYQLLIAFLLGVVFEDVPLSPRHSLLIDQTILQLV
jgi:hypothetical protein